MPGVSALAPPPSFVRRLVVILAVFVPLVVDPQGDTLAFKKLALGILGTSALALEAFEVFVLRRQPLRPTVAEWLLLALALWGACSLGWSPNPALGHVGVGVLFGMLGIARGVRQSIARESSVGRWIAALLTVGVVALVVDGAAVARYSVELDISDRKHASWLFKHNNMAANYAAVLAPLAAVLALAATSMRGRVVCWSLAAGVLAYQALLRSRAGMAATLLGVAAVGLLYFLRGRIARPGRRAATAMVVLCVVLALLPSSEQARGKAKEVFYFGVSLLEELEIGDLRHAAFRPGVYRRTMELVSESPVLGVGVGNFPVGYARYDPRVVEIPHAHNDALQVLAELGLVGLLLYLGLMSALLWQVLGGLAARDGGAGAVWSAGLGGALVVFWAGGLFEVPFALGDTACNLALLVALSARLSAAPQAWQVGRAARPLALVALLLTLSMVGLLARRLPASGLLASAQRALELGAYPEAREYLTELAELGTGSHVPYLQLGLLAQSTEDWQSALENFQAARRLWPYSLNLLELEAKSLMRLGRNDEAVARCEESVALTPGDRTTRARLCLFLAQAGRVTEAIDQATFLLQSHRANSIDIVALLARLHLRSSNEQTGDKRMLDLVASRHFYAVLLQDGDPRYFSEWNREFRHLTHQLQSLPGSVNTWWPTYIQFMSASGEHMPKTALWTAVDGEGQRLWPGWDEKFGPPNPR
jgi:O-antigen ligase